MSIFVIFVIPLTLLASLSCIRNDVDLKKAVKCVNICNICNITHIASLLIAPLQGAWPSGLYSLRQVTEVKLGRVRSDFGWVTTEA